MIAKLFINDVNRTPLRVLLAKEGDRAIDQIEVSVAYNVPVEVNQELFWLQDNVSLNYLSAVWNFQTSVKDESGNNNHGTSSGVTFSDDYWGGYACNFDGTNDYVSIPDSNSLDLSGKFDIITWLKWESTTEQYVFSKRSSTSNGFALSVNKTTAGNITFKIGSTDITSSSSGYNDGEWHMVRISRNASNLITLYVDNISKGTATVSTDLTDTNALLLGKDFGGTFYGGLIARLRIYKGYNITDQENKKLWTGRNPRSVMKFGGKITKIEDKTSYKDIIAQSFGKVLGETEIRGEVYDDRSPEYIVNDLITKNTNFEFIARGEEEVVMRQYLADGKLIDIVRNFASLTNKIFYTTPNKQFIFEPKEFNQTTISYIHGSTSKILENGYDDTEIVNDLTVLGQNQRYNTTETITATDASALTLLHGATSVKVSEGSTVLSGDVDYTVDAQGKGINFVTQRSGTHTYTVTYEYEIPLYYRGKKDDSINTYGIHAKRLNMPWITNNADGIRFVQSYLARYKDITRKLKVEIGDLENFVNENDLVFLTNSTLNIPTTAFVVKSIRWKYPEMETELNIGEYYFDYFEYDKQIVQKLHDVEGALTTIKDIRDYEDPQLLFSIAMTASQVIDQHHTQSINIPCVNVIYENTQARYGISKYGSSYRHGTGHVNTNGGGSRYTESSPQDCYGSD